MAAANEASLVIVRLDDTSVPAGPATVLERVSAVSALSKYKDRDGCRDLRIRVWSGVFGPGTRVSLGSV